MGDLHIYKGIVDAEADIGILERSAAVSATVFPWKSVGINWQCQSSFCMALEILSVYASLVFLHSWAVSYLKCMEQHEEENQTMAITDCLTFWIRQSW